MQISLRSLARLGAMVRLEQIDAERSRIARMFPGIKGGRVSAAPRRRRLSAAGRAAIVRGTKKRWAEWRRKQKPTQKETAA